MTRQYKWEEHIDNLLISNENDVKFQIESMLEYALKNAKEALNYQIQYIEHIENEIKKFPSSKLEELDITDQLDYLSRDLNPEYSEQKDALDTYGSNFGQVLRYIDSKRDQS